jgi:hypothetical protein
LIWYSILAVLWTSDKDVAFVTKNSRDFLADDGGLHPHLIEDLVGLGIDPNRVTPFLSASSAVDQLVKPHLATVPVQSEREEAGAFTDYSF